MEEKQAIDLLWEEWKYRHDYVWRTLFRWAAAVVVLWIAPFLKPEVFANRPRVAVVFPFVSFILTLFSAWLIGAEQQRLSMVSRKYNELRKDFIPPPMPKKTRWECLLAWPIGTKIVLLFYGFSLSIISGVIFYLLWTSK